MSSCYQGRWFRWATRAAGEDEARLEGLTVQAHAGLITRIIIPFEGYAGRYVWHCHMLERPSANGG